jgi:cell division topological specificity factor
MADWLTKLTGGNKSASEAKERLKLVLIHDRTDINPEVLEQLKDDLLEAISNHVSIDPGSAKITMLHEGREQRLVAEIPLKHFDRKQTG